ncbi:hypothetical protein ABZU45_33705 [Streptomyces avermitilis]|uniref:hypothetical protein n=1 Tax=Streptomyces avermitilis TaxID=33903 RepID=UPI0033A5BA42
MTMTPEASTGIWQPYTCEPLLTPAMAHGYDAVPAAELSRLRDYLDELVKVRRAPVHVSVAFNAVYFGYDLGGEGYGASPLDPDGFPVIHLRERIEALPVGAMVHIATTSQPLYAEIVYKEGQHPEIGPLGEVPGWVSGAPAGAEGPGRPSIHRAPVRRELLVPDLRAFGEALSLRPAQLNRLRDHARCIDEHGHVLVDAVHPSREAAERDEVSFYAAYLLTTARAQLLSPFVPVSLAELACGRDEELLRGTLMCLLDVIARVLASSDALRMWGSYAMACDDLAACWRDTGPLGGHDMSALAASLQYAAKPAAKRRYAIAATTTAYTAVGSRLRDFPGAAPLLSGLGYPTAVCRANLAIADLIRGESENGLFESGTRVSLDDAFEGGGVWRSHHPGTYEEDSDPLAAAGLGWRATTEPPLSCASPSGPSSDPGTESVAEPVVEPPTEPVDMPLDDATALGAGQLLRIGDSEVAWRMPLRLAHLMDGYLPLRPIIADELRSLSRGQTTVRLELTHPGGDLEKSEEVQDTRPDLGDGGGRLLDIEWPLDFFPGLELHLQWPRGGRVIRATTALLETPVTVGERAIEHRYDAAVLTREDAPGSTRTRDSATGLDAGRLVMRAVRRCGLLTPDGHALLDRSVLPTAVYGQAPAVAQAEALEAAVEELLAGGHLYPATGSRSPDGQPHHPARHDEQEIPLIGYQPNPVPVPRPPASHGASDRTWQSAPMALQYVPGHLRRLLPGSSPSDAQRAAFHAHCRRLGLANGGELPLGYTFVTPHTRGN